MHLDAQWSYTTGWIYEGQRGCSSNLALAFTHTHHRLGVSISLVNKNFEMGREASKICWEGSDVNEPTPPPPKPMEISFLLSVNLSCYFYKFRGPLQ